MVVSSSIHALLFGIYYTKCGEQTNRLQPQLIEINDIFKHLEDSTSILIPGCLNSVVCIYLENMDFLIVTDMSLNDGVDVTDQVPAPKVPDDY